MKDTLRTRLEFLWAKLAGRDVDIDTLTPDAPTNMVEKLMLETANRITDAEQGGGGGSDKFVVRFTPSGNTYVPDRTFAQIESAVNANKTVVGTVDGMGFVDLLICNQSYGAVFQALAPFDSDYATLYVLNIMPNDQTYVNMRQIPYDSGGDDPQPIDLEPLIIDWTSSNGVYTLDTTFQEIYDAQLSGKQVCVSVVSGSNNGLICINGCVINPSLTDSEKYKVVLPFFWSASDQIKATIFSTSTADGYPSYSPPIS